MNAIEKANRLAMVRTWLELYYFITEHDIEKKLEKHLDVIDKFITDNNRIS